MGASENGFTSWGLYIIPVSVGTLGFIQNQMNANELYYQIEFDALDSVAISDF